ncbi:MAG: hypothetical protein ACK4M1_09295 [Flavobacterium sp.]
MKYRLFLILLTTLLFISCSKTAEEVHKLEHITIKLQESQSFTMGKEFYYEPLNDTIINALNINIKDVINVIDTFYKSENNEEKVSFKNAKNIKMNLVVIKNNSSISEKDAFNELIMFLKQKKLVDF